MISIIQNQLEAHKVIDGRVVGTVRRSSNAAAYVVSCREGAWLEPSWDVALDSLAAEQRSEDRLAAILSA